jgi:hypothetical protein
VNLKISSYRPTDVRLFVVGVWGWWWTYGGGAVQRFFFDFRKIQNETKQSGDSTNTGEAYRIDEDPIETGNTKYKGMFQGKGEEWW